MYQQPISVALVEDNRDIRQGLKLIIGGTKGFLCLGAYPDAETGLPQILERKPDVVLMDIVLPGMSGIECVKAIKEKAPDIDIIMLTVRSDDDSVFQSLQAGACGYLTKNTPPSRLLEAIKEVQNGGAPMSSNVARMVVGSFNAFRNPSHNLTSREREVLDQLCKGKSYKMIADTLSVSQDTVRYHIKNIYKKLQVNSKSEAVIKALKNNIV